MPELLGQAACGGELKQWYEETWRILLQIHSNTKTEQIHTKHHCSLQSSLPVILLTYQTCTVTSGYLQMTKLILHLFQILTSWLGKWVFHVSYRYWRLHHETVFVCSKKCKVGLQKVTSDTSSVFKVCLNITGYAMDTMV